MTVSEFIAQYIVMQGIKDVFLLSGGGMMYMLDALGRNKDITIHCHNHEQDAGIAAEAFARITGKPGICFATSGPGGLNVVEAIAECWVDSVPVIFFIGQNKLGQTTRDSGIEGLRQHGASEIDIIPVVKSITKGAFFLDDPLDAKGTLYEAFALAQEGRKGPVVVNVPLDIQKEEMDNLYRSRVDILSLWENAKYPLILMGAGKDLRDIYYRGYAKNNLIPIVTTQAAKDRIPYDNPYFIGHVGIKGDRAANHAVQNADVILCVGASLHVFTTGYELDKFAPNAKIIYLEEDAALRKRCALKNVIKVKYDIGPLPEITPEVGWLASLNVLKEKYPVYAEPHKTEEGRINMYKALEIINKWSDNKDIIISDAGGAFYAVGQAWQLKEGQRFISSNGLGTMGWAIPAASGAFVASNRRVLCFTGDGSFLTGMNELETISREGMNVIVVVFNNDGYSSIRNTQDSLLDERRVATRSMETTSPWAIGNAFDIPVYTASCPKTLDILLSEIEEGPVILNILTNFDQEIIPTVQTSRDEYGNLVSGDLGNMYPYGVMECE